MAEDADKQSSSAERAYATAAAAVPSKVEPALPVATKAAVAETAKPAAPKAEKPVVRKVKAKSVKPAPAQSKKPGRKSAPVAAKMRPATSTKQPTITQLKDKIMATAKSTDFSKTVTDSVGEFQRRAKSAYDKSAELSAEATEFAKGNVEALVESGKILAAGAQDLGKSYASDAKSAYETATADLKEFAAVKSPTELFQLQGKLMRRNFDTMVAYGSKNTEAMAKLVNESFAPISSRMSLAAEKIAKAA